MTVFRIPPIAAVLAAFVLAACAGPSGGWTKVNASPEQMALDFDECQFFGQAAGLSAANQANDTYIGVSGSGQLTKTNLPGAGALGFMEQSDVFEKCMKARGYRRAAAN